MNGELIAALIGLAVTQFGLWMRFEHRMTVLETMLNLERERVTRRPSRAVAESQ